MQLYQWLCIFGIPTIVSGIVFSLWRQTKAIKLGIQALLRDRLLQGYKYFSEKGYADYDDRSSLENIYIQYEALGKNGVMTDLRNKFLKLPMSNDHR